MSLDTETGVKLNIIPIIINTHIVHIVFSPRKSRDGRLSLADRPVQKNAMDNGLYGWKC